MTGKLKQHIEACCFLLGLTAFKRDRKLCLQYDAT